MALVFILFSSAYIITQSYKKVKHIGQCVGDNVTKWVFGGGVCCYRMWDNKCYGKWAKVQFWGRKCNGVKNVTIQ
jgi:hypothetical protein